MKKAGLVDAMGLVEGLYPGAAAAGLRNFPESSEIEAPRIGEVYTKGTLTLARLGREAPIAAASPRGRGAAQRRGRQPGGARCSTRTSATTSPENLPRSPVIGTDAPVQYEQRDDIGAPRKRLPAMPPDPEGAIADPRAIRVRARDQRGRRDRGARAARLRGADHRRRPQPAADDEAAAGQPRAPDRHQRHRRARLHPRAGRRDQDRRADPARRPAEVRAAGASTSRSSATPRT